MPLRTKISLLAVHCRECSDYYNPMMLTNRRGLTCDGCGRVPKMVTFTEIFEEPLGLQSATDTGITLPSKGSL